VEAQSSVKTSAKAETKDNPLLFQLADLLGASVYLLEGQTYRSYTERTVSVGGLWTLPMPVTSCVDELSDTVLTAFIKIKMNLWAYAVLSYDPQTKETSIWMLFFDNDKTRIGAGAERSFGHGNSVQTLKKLKPAITEARVFTEGAWKPADPGALLTGI
jgi:hypothetical protein